ncbi:MAG TPA: hypothetical protein VMW81_00385 [Nitrospinota bacterium]|nr:hypothetical protein [Nitrospinota bacterium]
MIPNRELANSGSFPTCLTYTECPKCRYLSNSPDLDCPDIPCPKCSVSGLTRLIFPSLSALELLEMIGYFYSKACDRIDNLEEELVKTLQEQLGEKYDSDLAIKTAREIQNLYNKYDDKELEYNKMLEMIKERLSLQTIEEAQKAFVPLFKYDDSFEEHKVIVILTCTLLEKMFDDLLIKINISKGVDWSEAEKKVSQLRNFNKRCKAFEKITGNSLKNAIGQTSMTTFYKDWKDIRDKRNEFIHRRPFAIGKSTAEKAFNLAKNACSLFACLQNHFCANN